MSLTTLYKMDSKGKIRFWTAEIDGAQWRGLSGVMGGKTATPKWTVSKPKSKPTAEEQAAFEAQAAWQYKVDRDYYETLAEAQTGVPKMFEPMLAEKYPELTVSEKDHIFIKGGALMQPKLDGVRCIMSSKYGVRSRENQEFKSIPHIIEAVQAFRDLYPELTLDGELYNHEYKADFNTLSGTIRDKDQSPEQLAKSRDIVQYHVYDVAGPGQTAWERLRVFLNWLHSNPTPYVKIVPTEVAFSEQDFDEFDFQMVDNGYEGSMLRLPGPYEVGKRSDLLLKRKIFETEEFKCLRIEEGVGNWSGAAKRIVIARDGAPDGEVGCGTRGDYLRQAEILRTKERYEGGLVTVRHFGVTPDGSLRHPVVTDYHPNGRMD